MRSSSKGTATARASKTIATAVTRKTTDHFLRAGRGLMDDSKSVEPLWRGIVTEHKGGFKDDKNKKMELIKCASLGPAVLIGGFKPLGSGCDRGAGARLG